MKLSTIQYIKLLVFHAVIGVLIFVVKELAILYSILIVLFGLYFVIKYKDNGTEVLLVCAYITGVEVFLRMTKGNPNHEFSKYAVMIFMIIGMYYKGFSKNAFIYWIYLVLLFPGLIIGAESLDNATLNIRKTLAFNISGPVCLGVCALYCYARKISFDQINNILLCLGLPIFSMAVYLFFYTPDLDELKSTSSTALTSGGYGANQVATLLGLGMFVFYSRAFLVSPNRKLFIINLTLGSIIAYRGLVTFSRGGMVTGFLMLLVLLILIYSSSNNKGKYKLVFLISLFSGLLIFMWSYTELQTNGLITKRYTNRDALGREKTDVTTGREELSAEEIEIFIENPIFGVGVGKAMEIRAERTGIYGLPSHNEITRLLAEHGSLGIAILILLILTPIILYIDNKQNIYLFCFLTFWFLSLNHAAMRTASPSFVYALSLLKIKIKDEKDIVHRE